MMMNFLRIVCLGFLSAHALAQECSAGGKFCLPTEDWESGTAGADVRDLFPGMSIFGSPRLATLYDTANPTGGQAGDFGTQPQEGLVLVLNQKRRVPTNNPKSYTRGGMLTIMWDEEVSISSIGFLDIEERSWIRMYTASGKTLFSSDLPTTGNGELGRLEVGVDCVKKLLIMFGGTGAVTDIEYCDDPPIVTGDPHFKTWGHKWIDYHGQCDLVLMHATNFDGKGHDLDIHVRTTVSYGYSFIESAAIKIGNDILEVSGEGWYGVNGVETAYLGGKGGHLAEGYYPVYHTKPDPHRETFDIVLSPTQNITLSSFKDLVSVSVTGGMSSAEYYGESVGMLGSFNGELLARDGKTRIHDMNAFGQEWQVTDSEPKLFMTDRAPQYPAKCILPTPETANLRRLGGRNDQDVAVAACKGVRGYKHNDCVQEVRLSGDVSLAEKYKI